MPEDVLDDLKEIARRDLGSAVIRPSSVSTSASLSGKISLGRKAVRLQLWRRVFAVTAFPKRPSPRPWPRTR